MLASHVYEVGTSELVRFHRIGIKQQKQPDHLGIAAPDRRAKRTVAERPYVRIRSRTQQLFRCCEVTSTRGDLDWRSLITAGTETAGDNSDYGG